MLGGGGGASLRWTSIPKATRLHADFTLPTLRESSSFLIAPVGSLGCTLQKCRYQNYFVDYFLAIFTSVGGDYLRWGNKSKVTVRILLAEGFV